MKKFQSLLSIVLCFVLLFGFGWNAIAQSPKTITNSIGMKLVLIPKGIFHMGSPVKEERLKTYYDEVQHDVAISKYYYLGAFEVTQAQYKKVMCENPSRFQGDELGEQNRQTGKPLKEIDGSNHPVERVTWEDAVKFCKLLSELPEEKKAGRIYRLPTEAEWEYACRAGSKTAFSFDEKLNSEDEYIWHSGNSNGQTNPVGRKKPNAWGLHDMHGNVWEWCSDKYSEYPKNPVIDPAGSEDGVGHVIRGGCWGEGLLRCRSANRKKFEAVCCGFDWLDFQNGEHGFRVAMVPNSFDI